VGAVVSSQVVSAAPSSSCSATAPAWGPSHGRQFSTSCPSMGPSHGLQPLRNWLLQGGCFPWGHQPCQQTCSGVGSSLCRSCQEPAPAWAPQGITASFRHPPALAWGPSHGLQVNICSSVAFHGLQGQPAPPWSAAGEPLLWHLEQLRPSICTNCGLRRVVSLTPSCFSLPLQLLLDSFGVFSCLNTLSQRCYHCC